MSKIALYPGTFDPITYGHMDILKRAVSFFDQVIVAIADHLQKRPLFTLEERVQLTVRVCRDDQLNVVVEGFQGLLAHFAQKKKADVILRGLRGMTDFEYECQLAQANRVLCPTLETVFILPSAQYQYISSGLVKEIALLGGEIQRFVALPVAQALDQKLRSASTT